MSTKVLSKTENFEKEKNLWYRVGKRDTDPRVIAIRQPRGPDGTKGFKKEYFKHYYKTRDRSDDRRISTRRGKLDDCQVLVSNGTLQNTLDSDNNTPSHCAVNLNAMGVVKGVKTNGSLGVKTNGSLGVKTNGSRGVKTNGSLCVKTNGSLGVKTNGSLGVKTNGSLDVGNWLREGTKLCSTKEPASSADQEESASTSNSKKCTRNRAAKTLKNSVEHSSSDSWWRSDTKPCSVAKPTSNGEKSARANTSNAKNQVKIEAVAKKRPYAGARFEEPPSPRILPMPPFSWIPAKPASPSQRREVMEH